MADAKHQAERTKHDATKQRLQEAERKLNEVPLELLARVQQLVNSASFTEVSRLLAGCAEIITRHKEFIAVESKPLTLRAFARSGDRLFAVAKVSPVAQEHLRVDDPFELVKKTGGGLEVQIARLVVHQPPNLKDEGVFFAILPPMPPELESIAALAAEGDVQGLKGYFIRPAYDASRYAAHDLSSVPAAVVLLIEDATRRPPGTSP